MNKVEIREATVISIKPSAVRKYTYFITVNDGFGEIKVVGKRNYKIGETIKIRRKNLVDWIWLIEKEKI